LRLSGPCGTQWVYWLDSCQTAPLRAAGWRLHFIAAPLPSVCPLLLGLLLTCLI
jgi:hypothetical protein